MLGEALLGGIMALFCALNLLYIYLIRKRIAFAVAMLEICSACIQNYPSTIFVSVFGLLLQVCVCVRLLCVSDFLSCSVGTERALSSSNGSLKMRVCLSRLFNSEDIAKTRIVSCDLLIKISPLMF